MIKKTTSKSTSFNWKKWLIVLVLFIIAFPLIRYVIAQFQKFKEQAEEKKKKDVLAENRDPVVAQNKRDKITTRKDVQQASQEIAHHLGTKYVKDFDIWFPSSWQIFNPKAWTENDKKVADILLYQNKNYHYLKLLYNQVDTQGRNLTNDIYQYLDESELKRVMAKFKIT